jgi:hypothetical protein
MVKLVSLRSYFMRNRETKIIRTTTQGYNLPLLNFQQIGDMILHTDSERCSVGDIGVAKSLLR